MNDLTPQAIEGQARTLGFRSGREWVLRLCPIGEWPGRDRVDLDNVGDPGFWLDDATAGDAVGLLVDPSSDGYFSDLMATAYVERWEELGGTIRQYFDSDDDCKRFRADIVQEFEALIIAWRAVVMAAIR